MQRKESLRTGLWSREDVMVSADRVVPMPWGPLPPDQG